METDILIVGAGLTGAVMAEQFATKLNKKVLIIDQRDHIGGNCYDYIDEESGILVNKYGAHIFHTNDEGVWNYVNKFSNWLRYDHKVVASVNGRTVPVPVNMETINILSGEALTTSDEVNEWLQRQQIHFENPKNSEEISLSRVGRTLYDMLFKPYTIKQWGVDPKELDPSVMARIPVRTDNDPRYFSDKFQGIPEKGYTSLFKRILDHPNITVKLNTEFNPECFTYKQLIFTGRIDSYFKNCGLPELKYRSLRFEIERFKNVGYMQSHFVINTPSSEVPSTRSIEYKHLPYPKTSNTILIKEYPSDEGDPYYPIPSPETQRIYKMYQELADNESVKGVHFVGRLANYKYFNMDQAVRNALDYFDKNFTF